MEKRPRPVPGTIKNMFDHLAPFYDRVNRVMSWGQDERWRQIAAEVAAGDVRELALDVAAGTGRLSLALARLHQNVVSLDMSSGMITLGKNRIRCAAEAERIHFVLGDAMGSPFRDNTFDCAAIGFATRNVVDLRQCFVEMRRVVKPGAKVVCLELSHPEHRLVNAVYRLYLRAIVPFLGKLFSGQPGAYRWLGQSLTGFPRAGELRQLMEEVGMREVGFRRLQFGAVAIHWGTK